MPRPDRLPRAAVRVVEWSRVLPAGVKLVWIKDYWLDIGPEGAFVSATGLADMLGMQPLTVDRYRRFLARAGLHESQGAGRGTHWYCTLPADCVPAERAKQPEVAIKGALLDAHLRARAGPAETQEHHPPIAGSSSCVQVPESRSIIRGSGLVMGGRQGGSSSVVQTEVSSSSQDRTPDQRRRGSSTPDRKVEKPPAGFSRDWRQRLGARETA